MSGCRNVWHGTTPLHEHVVILCSQLATRLVRTAAFRTTGLSAACTSAILSVMRGRPNEPAPGYLTQILHCRLRKDRH